MKLLRLKPGHGEIVVAEGDIDVPEQERIATISISVNYIQTATEGEIVCRSVLDRRNRTTAVLRSEVRHEDGRLIATAIGSYAIFPRRDRARPGPPAR